MADGNKLTRTDENDGPIGAGGLMAKFTRETDDVRMATSLASGMLIQYLTTRLTCVVLAFTRSWALTLVILFTVPILMLIQGISQGLASPLLASERQQSAIVATIIDRTVSAISTVKAFNAAPHEHSRTERTINTCNHTIHVSLLPTHPSRTQTVVQGPCQRRTVPSPYSSSSGTLMQMVDKIHTYKFNNWGPSPKYELFKMTQFGLSSFAGTQWTARVAVKATAGLRLLPAS